MEPSLITILTLVAGILFLLSMRELIRWYLRLNTLEDKVDHLHKILVRMEDNLIQEFPVVTEETPKKQTLFLIKERLEEESPLH